MSEITFMVGGRECTAAELRRNAPKAPPKSSITHHKATHDRSEAALSMGFMVLARQAGYEDMARASYHADIKRHEEKPKENKHPGMFDDYLRRWKSRNKPTRLTRRPYQLKQAADEFAALAEKQGWIEVEVEEQLKT